MVSSRAVYCSFAYSALASLLDGDIGIGIFPQRQEVLVTCQGAGACDVRIGTGGVLRLQRIRSRHAESCERPSPAVPYDTAVVKNLLEFGGGFLALTCCHIRLAANVRRIQAGDVGDESGDASPFDRRQRLSVLMAAAVFFLLSATCAFDCGSQQPQRM